MKEALWQYILCHMRGTLIFGTVERPISRTSMCALRNLAAVLKALHSKESDLRKSPLRRDFSRHTLKIGHVCARLMLRSRHADQV